MRRHCYRESRSGLSATVSCFGCAQPLHQCERCTTGLCVPRSGYDPMINARMFMSRGKRARISVVENAKRHDAAQFQRSPPAFHKTTVPAICTFGGMPADLAPRVRMTSQHTIHKDVCAMGGYYSVSLGLWSHVCRRNDCVGFWNCPATATHSRHLLLNVPPMVALGFWAPG